MIVSYSACSSDAHNWDYTLKNEYFHIFMVKSYSSWSNLSKRIEMLIIYVNKLTIILV